METTIVYCGYMGIMEEKIETSIVYHSILLGLFGDNGREAGNYQMQGSKLLQKSQLSDSRVQARGRLCIGQEEARLQGAMLA